MESLAKLVNEWEIQLLVLFSFIVQVFLFFTGGLRQRTRSSAVRLSIWVAYLGADYVAVYAIGLLSRPHGTATAGNNTSSRENHNQLAFFWTPFLLIHLGGQDTITAFAMEDNKLWLRHLLNLMVQACLVLYAFWNLASSDHRMQMQQLLSGILVFVTGMIKYGERILSLYSGSLEGLVRLRTGIPGYFRQSEISIVGDVDDDDIFFLALYSMRFIRYLFGDVGFQDNLFGENHQVREGLLTKLLEVELGLMYADLYTKAAVLRTRAGIIIRGISRISFVVAFLLFCVSNKQRYDPADVAVTYVLFAGGFFLEACAVFVGTMSLWACAWLMRHHNGRVPARFLLLYKQAVVRWHNKQQLWSNSMGQYSLFRDYLGEGNRRPSCTGLAMAMVARRVLRKICGENLMQVIGRWISKASDTEFVEVDEEIMQCVAQSLIARYGSGQSGDVDSNQQWPNIGHFIERLLEVNFGEQYEFRQVIICFHYYTEVQLSRYSPAAGGEDDNGVNGGLVTICRKLSNYMIYLVNTHPETLPFRTFEPFAARLFAERTAGGENLGSSSSSKEHPILRAAVRELRRRRLPEPQPSCRAETLLEIQQAWIQILVHAAVKCPAELHAAQLAKGGQLLTFVWLLAAHYEVKESNNRMELSNVRGRAKLPFYAFHLPQDQGNQRPRLFEPEEPACCFFP